MLLFALLIILVSTVVGVAVVVAGGTATTDAVAVSCYSRRAVLIAMIGAR